MLQPFFFDGLQQVVNGKTFKGLDCILLVSGGENNIGFILELFNYFKTGEVGHLDIQENKIRTEGVNFLNSFPPVSRLVNYFNTSTEFS